MNPDAANFWWAFMSRGEPVGRPIVQSRARYFMAHAKQPSPPLNQESLGYSGPGKGVSGETTN